MSTYEISKSSLLSLKAEILRKQQDLIKAKADNEVKIKVLKKNTPLEIKNKGIEARQKNDLTEEEEDLLKKSRSVLEAKSKLYDKLSSGEFTNEERERNKRFLVRFNRKKLENRTPDLIDFEDLQPDHYPESDEDRYHSDEDEANKDPGEKWVDYTDCLGRTRECLQKDLEYLLSKDEELKKTVESKNTNQLDEECTNTVVETESKDENVDKKVQAQESELLSNDMRRELLRQQWEKEEEELRDKTNIHYQDILFGEARSHGVGYYGFSKDEEERAKQQEALRKLRNETEAKQKSTQELKSIREKQLAARVKAAKDRKRARLGLPPEEDSETTVAQPEISDKEKKEEEELKKNEEEKERLLDEARKKHVRPWDIGKEGVKEHYEMTQEEWVDKKRDERTQEFAPPQAYDRKFRSSVNISHSEEGDKTLKFTSKKNKNQRRNRKPIHSYIPQKGEMNQKNDADADMLSNYIDKSSENSRYKRRNYKTDDPLSNVDDALQDCSQSIPFEPVPIEEEDVELEFDDHLLADYHKCMDITNSETDDTSRKRGVEIAPPPTYDYYGPNDKRPKFTKANINIENSIEAGLKFLRRQVEDRQSTSRHRSDYTSPF